MFKNFLKKFIPSFLLISYHYLLALLGAVFYQFPSKKMVVIGVTGTNGKSTVVELTSKILEEAGYKVASVSSLKFKVDEREHPNLLKQTMPGRFQLQKFLREAVNSSCKYAVLEVTSEGIKQYRHKFIDFDAAVFTNLTPEHIEAHGSFEKYKEAKGQLFQSTRKAHIINADDKNAEYFLQFPADEKLGYTLSQSTINNQQLTIVKADEVNLKPDGIEFSIDNIKFHLSLLGSFNVSNALAAICVGLSQGISLETCKTALEKVKGIPGRMELVIQRPFQVFVDYAFTPAALEKVYKTLKPKTQDTSYKLLCVLGAAGGGRDKWKRPVLGKLASQYCDEIIITNEDPYNESPMEIINQVAEGVRVDPRSYPRGSASIHKILDRREAIQKALSLAKPNDTVVITGKGSEPWMCVAGGKKIPWDDRRVVREEVQKLSV